jgi:hypothetical protein
VVAFVPTARAYAREVAPGSELVTLTVTPVRSGALADVARSSSQLIYVFRPERPDGNGACRAASVTIKGDRIEVLPATGCAPGIQLRCTGAQVWKRAALPADATATIVLTRGGRISAPTWFVTDGNRHSAVIGNDCDTAHDPDPKPASTDRHPIRTPTDYDIHHFDLVAWLPNAERQARAMASDARLYGFKALGVSRDGRIDLRPPDGTKHWTRSVFADFRSSNEPCMVRVVPTDDHVNVFSMTHACSDAPAPALPRCTLAQVWKWGVAKAAPPDDADLDSAIIEWDGDKRLWKFELWDRGGMFELVDGC